MRFSRSPGPQDFLRLRSGLVGSLREKSRTSGRDPGGLPDFKEASVMCLPGLLREVSPGGLPGLRESPVAVRSSGGLREASRAAGELPEASRSSGSPPGGLPSYREVSGGFPGLREALREPFCLREAFGGVPGLREVPKGPGPPGGLRRRPGSSGSSGELLGSPQASRRPLGESAPAGGLREVSRASVEPP